MPIEHSTDIAAPAERIWNVMIDVARWPEWTPTVTSVELLDKGSFRVGSRARLHQPRLPTAVWTVTLLEPGHRFTWQSLSPGVIAVADHRIEPRGTSTMSSVILRLEWSGWLAPFIHLLYGKLARRYVRTEGEALKRRCEGAHR